jgi:predicted PurR-regulated permease PerM
LASPTTDIVRNTFAVLLIGALIGVSLWVLRPFLPALAWAAMTVIATWPAMLTIEKRLWQRRGLSAAVMTSAFLLIIILPVSLAVVTIIENIDTVVNWVKSLGNLATPEAPDWLKGLPYVGKRFAARWQELAAITPEELKSHLLPYAGAFLRWLAGQMGNLGSLLLQFIMTLLISAVLYVKGEEAAGAVRSVAKRIAGAQGEQSVRLAGQAVRAVAMGVVVSSVALGVFTWVGLAAAGVPYAMLLAAAVFMLNVVQLGPVPVLVPAVIWLYWKEEPVWATALLAWTLLAVVLDRVLGPVLIRKGAKVSLLLILPGVIGGLIAFGFIGIFIGPVVLAVAGALLSAWAMEGDSEIRGHVSSAADTGGQES